MLWDAISEFASNPGKLFTPNTAKIQVDWALGDMHVILTMSHPEKRTTNWRAAGGPAIIFDSNGFPTTWGSDELSFEMRLGKAYDNDPKVRPTVALSVMYFLTGKFARRTTSGRPSLELIELKLVKGATPTVLKPLQTVCLWQAKPR